MSNAIATPPVLATQTPAPLANALDLAQFLGEIVISGAIDTAGGSPSLLVGLDRDGLTTANALALSMADRPTSADLVRVLDAMRVQLEHLTGADA